MEILWYIKCMMEETEPKRRGRPATGQTPKRNIRIGTVWDDAEKIAVKRGEKMTQVVEAELRRYVQRHRALLDES